MGTGAAEFGDIEKRLKDLGWHDSRLGDVLISQDENGLPKVVLEVQFIRGWNKYQPGTVVFVDCLVAEVDLDLKARRAVNGDIGIANCSVESDLKKRIRDDFGPEVLVDDYLQFSVVLIQPAGCIKVLARDFEVHWR
ncbi:MAG: hypothetical protein WA188_11850 [Terriglobales bacterium]